MRVLALILSVVVLGVLAGCATLSEDECAAGDWRSIGATDGANGYPLARLERNREACAEYGVAVDRTLYLEGRERGLVSYCRLERAEREGLTGGTYYNVCTGPIGTSFERVYAQAVDVRDVELDLRSAQNDLDDLYRRRADPNLSNEEQAQLSLEIGQAQFDVRDLERELRSEERDLAAARRAETRSLSAGGIAY